MLTLHPIYFYSILILLTAVSFFIKLSVQSFSFYKIIILFVLFVFLNAFLAFFGEDFFVALAVATELPVFFSFFFFLTTKSQMNVDINKIPEKTIKPIIFSLPILFLFIFFAVSGTGQQFIVYAELMHQSQKSDFFLFFLFFYVLAPKMIFFVGVLITLTTLFLVYITFNAQLLSLVKIKKNKEIAWAKNQNQTNQTAKKSSTLHFRP